LSSRASSDAVLVVPRRLRATQLLYPAAHDDAESPSIDVLMVIAAGLARAVTGAELPLRAGMQRDFARLLATPAYEAWLIAWAPGGALTLHDHGGSHGAAHVAHGDLTEAFTDARSDARLQTRTLGAGSGVTVPAERVHEVWNPGPGRALSVHVYSPPLRSMTFFEPAGDGSLVAARTEFGDVAALEEGAER
jgi:hypothetical protein